MILRLRRDVQGAFTLIEVLIVIAIVALLASFVVPLAGRAQGQAKVMSCRAHLHNIGVALVLHANDHDGELPVTRQVDGPHEAMVRALERYVSQKENFYCPGETRPERRFSPENAEAGRIGYFYYSCQRPSNNQEVSGFLRFDVRWPRELRATTNPQAWVLSDVWFRGEETPHPYYRKGMNYLQLGGTVDMVEESPRKAFN